MERIPSRSDPLDELWFRKPVRQHIKEFGCVLGIISLALAGHFLWRGRIADGFAFSLTAFLVIGLGYLAPSVLRPVWSGFQAFGHVLGSIFTFVFLLVSWSAGMLPTAFGLKLFGVKVMDMTFRAPVETYWVTREERTNDFQLLKRQF